ncbi:hypothetical protein RRG08_005000, partial [Elysia crispata]
NRMCARFAPNENRNCCDPLASYKPSLALISSPLALMYDSFQRYSSRGAPAQ